MRVGLVVSAAVVAMATASPAQAQADVRRYDIEAQDLAAALRRFAAISGREVVASAELVTGKRSGGVRGQFAPDDALAQLLTGTGLRVELVEGAFVLRPFDGELAQEQEAERDIIVTGSRIRGAPVASPVIALDQESIRDAGQATVADAVRTIPQNFGGGQNPGVGFNVSEDYTPEPDSATKPEMLSIVPIAPPDCVDPERATGGSSYANVSTGPLVVGITWQGPNIDLDLHARPRDGAPWLFFARTRSDGGRFEKRSAVEGPTGARGFEWVSFDNVNIREVRIGVNLYEVLGGGEARGGARGQLRAAFAGRCYVRDFQISAHRGDHGAGRDDPQRSGRAEWLELNLADMILGTRS